MNELTKPDDRLDLQTKLKIKYPELTETDLEYQETFQQDMLCKVECKFGETQKEMK